MRGFNPSKIIDNPQYLFGRNKSGELLEQLTYYVKSGTNVQIQGERRIGKTSTLRSLEYLLLKKEKFIIPVYLNLKQEPLIKKDNVNVYRYILAKSLSNLTKYRKIKFKFKSQGKSIKAIIEYRKIYTQLQKIDDFLIQGILEDFFKIVNTKYNIGFVLLIDEYEHLFRISFENPNGFFVFRDFTQMPSKSEVNPLCFIIAGSQSWEQLCTLTGSSELNNLGASILYVSPLLKENFIKMWDYSIKNISSFIPETSILLNYNKIFDLVGGFPFYAKLIGETILNNPNTEINYSILKEHFEEIFNNLSEKELSIINKIIRDEPISVNATINNLLSRGIIKQGSNNYKFNGLLISNYFIDKFDNINLSTVENKQIVLVKKIELIQELIYKINNNRQNRNKKDIFICSNDETKLYKDLEKPCLDADGWMRFSSALYLTQFERTKGRQNRNMEQLPNGFGKDHSFVKIIDVSRHLLGGGHKRSTFKVTSNSSSKEDALNFLKGDINEPNKFDYYKMQIKALDEYAKYLNDLNNYIEINNY